MDEGKKTPPAGWAADEADQKMPHSGMQSEEENYHLSCKPIPFHLLSYVFPQSTLICADKFKCHGVLKTGISSFMGL